MISVTASASASSLEKAYERWLDGAFLRQGQARGSFEYAGILFEEYLETTRRGPLAIPLLQAH
jgi:hypothetical protein